VVASLTSFKGGVLEVGLPVQDTGLQLVLDTPEKKKFFRIISLLAILIVRVVFRRPLWLRW
jgi:hypothetical protein